MASEKKDSSTITGNNSEEIKNNSEPNSNENERAQWNNKLQFLMSCIAMSVGFGNIWRFPFIAYENGGGAFLLPYIIVLIIVGRPFYFLEMCLGQFTSRTVCHTFRAIGHGFEGIAYVQILVAAAIASYYCCVMAIALYYLLNSFTSTLPWSYCREEWNQTLLENGLTCIASVSKQATSNTSLSSSELFYKWEVLREKTQIYDGIGLPDWRLTLCLLFSWIICFLVSSNGIKSSGKFSYFLALFPYVIIFAIFFRGVTLEGSTKGLLYFITPRWEKLLKADVWYAAVTQCFFSLNVGTSSITMYSSYNSFDHNVNRDAFVVTTVDTFTSLLSGATIFSILGNLAHEMNVEVDSVISSGGTGIAFISYPEAIAKFESVPWLFAILFFLMLWILGLGCLVALQSAINSVIVDHFPNVKHWYVSAATATCLFLVGLCYVTPGGQFILTLVDHFGGTFVIFIGACFEIIAVCFVYGFINFCYDIEYMTKKPVNVFWKIMWGFVSPLVVFIIFIYFIFTIEEITYGSYIFPKYVLGLGWMILALGIFAFVFFVAKAIIQNRKLGYPKMVTESFKPIKWGPENPKRKQEWMEFKTKKMNELNSKKTRLQKIWYFLKN